MIEYVVLSFIAVVILILLWLRTNTAIGFLALCAGSVLLASSGDNLGLIATSVTSGIEGSTNVVKIVLLLVPLAVSAVVLRGHVGKSLFIFSFFTATATALLGVLLVVPLLSEPLQNNIADTQTWVILLQYKEFIVGVGLILSLIMISMTIKRQHERRHKKRGRHR